KERIFYIKIVQARSHRNTIGKAVSQNWRYVYIIIRSEGNAKTTARNVFLSQRVIFGGFFGRFYFFLLLELYGIRNRGRRRRNNYGLRNGGRRHAGVQFRFLINAIRNLRKRIFRSKPTENNQKRYGFQVKN